MARIDLIGVAGLDVVIALARAVDVTVAPRLDVLIALARTVNITVAPRLDVVIALARALDVVGRLGHRYRLGASAAGEPGIRGDESQPGHRVGDEPERGDVAAAEIHLLLVMAFTTMAGAGMSGRRPSVLCLRSRRRG